MMVFESGPLILAYDSKVLVQSASGMKRRRMLMRTDDWSDDEQQRINLLPPIQFMAPRRAQKVEKAFLYIYIFIFRRPGVVIKRGNEAMSPGLTVTSISLGEGKKKIFRSVAFVARKSTIRLAPRGLKR